MEVIILLHQQRPVEQRRYPGPAWRGFRGFPSLRVEQALLGHALAVPVLDGGGGSGPLTGQGGHVGVPIGGLGPPAGRGLPVGAGDGTANRSMSPGRSMSLGCAWG